MCTFKVYILVRLVPEIQEAKCSEFTVQTLPPPPPFRKMNTITHKKMCGGGAKKIGALHNFCPPPLDLILFTPLREIYNLTQEQGAVYVISSEPPFIWLHS